MPKQQPLEQQPLANRVWTLAKHPQFFWWCGHCVVLFCTSLYFWYWITLSASQGINYYRAAYLGAMLSYGVVIYKTYGKPQFNSEYYRRIIKDENIFYLMLALMWYMSTPIFVTLIPYATFSLFHFITYFRTNILQTFFPAPQPSSSSSGTQNEWANNFSKTIQNWVHKNYEQAMNIVSFVEVVIITLFLLLNIITFQLGIFVLFTYCFFLRKRYHMNHYTRQTFAIVAQNLDRAMANPKVSPYVKNAYQHAKSAVTWFGRMDNPHSSRR